MARGLCCAAQAAGDLGKPIVVTIHKRDGTTQQRCGVCEIIPSCRNPQKRVFAFRFLQAGVCGLAAAKCAPTAAGEAQYSAEIGRARGGLERTEYLPIYTNGGLPFAQQRVTGLTPRGLPAGTPITSYMLPS